MTTAFLPRGAVKETRALLPIWLACVVAVVAGGLIHDSQLRAMALLAFMVGTVALGAHAIGHEYTHRTMGWLLSQPSHRGRLFLTKIAVLAVLLLALSAMAWLVLLSASGEVVPRWVGPPAPAVLLVAASGLFVAPLLTMLSRSSLAGVVFTLVVPVVLLMAGDLAGVALHGSGGGELVDGVKYAVFSRGMIIVCAVAAVASWGMFKRLEAIDGRGADVRLPEWLRRRDDAVAHTAPPARVHPVWRLVWKELHIQQITFVVCALYVVLWAAGWLLARLVPHTSELSLALASGLYVLFVPVLAGSLASAEERQFGTLEPQLLLPMAASKQFAVKGGVAIGVAIVLGCGVPAVLGSIHAGGTNPAFATAMWRPILAAVFLLSACSLYVSSLSTSGVRAMVLSLPVILGLSLAAQTIMRVWWSLPILVNRWTGAERLHPSFAEDGATAGWLLLAIGAGLVVLLVRYAFVNHRTTERSTRVVVRQVVVMVAFVTLATVLGAVALYLLA